VERRDAELQAQIALVIGRLQEIQRAIAGTRQPATAIELETLEELGRRYAKLRQELQDCYQAAQGEEPNRE
jgi:hypothetical protein